MAGQCFFVVTAPVSAHERMTFSSRLMAVMNNAPGPRARWRAPLRATAQTCRNLVAERAARGLVRSSCLLDLPRHVRGDLLQNRDELDLLLVVERGERLLEEIPGPDLGLLGDEPA